MSMTTTRDFYNLLGVSVKSRMPFTTFLEDFSGVYFLIGVDSLLGVAFLEPEAL